MADDFERACICALSQSLSIDAQTKSAAEQSINQLKVSPDGWKFCMQKFPTCVAPEASFWCITVIEETVKLRITHLQQADIDVLRQFFEYCASTYFPQHPDSPVWILNKWASALIHVFQSTYLTTWRNFFPWLIGSLQHGVILVDIFCRVLRCIDEEIISNDFQRGAGHSQFAMQIKDTMRAESINEIVNVWGTILTSMATSSPHIARMALNNIRYYVEWIDINLIVNDRFLPLIMSFLNVAGLNEKAAECLLAIAAKKMDASNKMALLARLQIVNMFSTMPYLDDVEFESHMARLLHHVCMEYMHCWEKFERAQDPSSASMAEQMTVQCLPQVLRFLDSTDDDVQGEIVECINTYISKVKSAGLNDVRGQHLQAFLNSVALKMKFPANYNWTVEGDDENGIQAFRAKLGRVFTNIARVAPEACILFVSNLCAQVLQCMTQLPYADVEVAIDMLYEMGEGVKIEQLQSDSMFSHALAMVLGSNVSEYPHRAVQVRYFDVAARYSRWVPAHMEVMPTILQAFVDARGLRNASVQNRARCCTQLLRFVKGVERAVLPYSMQVLSSIQEFVTVPLRPSSDDIPFEDRVNLFECIGCLLDDSAQSLAILQAIAAPLIQQLDSVIDQKLYLSDTVGSMVYIPHLCNIIYAIGTMSKSIQTSRPEVVALFQQGFERVVKVFNELSNSREIRTKVVFYLHRMVEVLKREVIPYLPRVITPLLQFSQEADLTDLSRLGVQIMSKFKSELGGFISSLLLPLSSRVSELLATSYVQQGFDTTRQRQDLFKAYLLFIQHIVTDDLMGVLVDSVNGPHLSTILSHLINGCIDSTDHATGKLCVYTFNTLTETWGNGEFGAYICQQVLPVLFGVLPTLSARDAQSVLLFQEIAQLFVTASKRCPQFSDSVNAFLIAMQAQAIIQGFFEALQTGDARHVTAFLRTIYGGG
eukprot:TRINITY_DN8816_c0_g1_i2.p1 TRINITY_DN8816_c0_g1~~TRINITY_DN8816_c0_g1_i2.p1  ORF type:complete len:947 (+),score=174.00 TRINITY_DN8816_c0_g1_i2:35-2842(+)